MELESVSVISLRVRDLLVLDDVPALVLLGELQVEVQLVALLAGGGNAEAQEPHPGQGQAGQQVGGLGQGLTDCDQEVLQLTNFTLKSCSRHTTIPQPTNLVTSFILLK